MISAPSLDTTKNVSGISSVVRQIVRVLQSEVAFRRIEVGSEQAGSSLARTSRSIGKSISAAWSVLGFQYDILHLNTALNPRSAVRDLVLAWLARVRQKPVVMHLHGGRYLHDRSNSAMDHIARLLFASASRVIALSSPEKDALASRFPRDALKFTYLTNSVDLDAARAFVKAANGANGLAVVFVGRLVEEKGIWQLLVAARSGLRDVSFALFGEGPLKEAVRDAARQNPDVIYRGVFGADQTFSVLSQFDVLLLPSLSGEGMPMAVLEAMAVGVVPICTGISASLADTITDGWNGFLIEPASSDAIEGVLKKLRDNEELRRVVGERARAYAESHLDSRKNYEKLRRLYQELLAIRR